jgi:hypothetical protein
MNSREIEAHCVWGSVWDVGSGKAGGWLGLLRSSEVEVEDVRACAHRAETRPALKSLISMVSNTSQNCQQQYLQLRKQVAGQKGT